jgi:Multicopper oxidase
MRNTNMKKQNRVTGLLPLVVAALALLLSSTAQAAVPGISGTSFSFTAAAGFITQPDGVNIYSWGYSCAGSSPTFVPFTGTCPAMQIPGPTLVVTQNASFTVTLTNNLPNGAGNTSIVFPGAMVTTTGGTAGLLTREATPGTSGAVTYTVTYSTAGTHAYYSGTQPDLQVEMGLYGAVVVLPATSANTGNCSALGSDVGQRLGGGSTEFRLAKAAYDHPEACYDREYLWQWSEIDPRIHRQADQQLQSIASCPAANPTPNVPCPTTLAVSVEPYHPSYFLINGRSMPDDMDPDYAPNYPNQPYNGNPHMHPGDLVLLRVIGQGHWQHPFHEHANHVRILARDGRMLVSQNDSVTPPRLAGRMEFNTDTTPGQAFDGIFYWSGKGLGWDIYAHTPAESTSAIATATESGTTVTLTTFQALTDVAGHPLTSSAGLTTVTLTGMPAGYNGTFPITSLTLTTSPSPGPGNPGNPITKLTYTASTSGLAPYSGSLNPSQNQGLDGAVSVLLATSANDPNPCIPDANGYYTVNSKPPAPIGARNYYEWCADHNHPLETNPVGQVGGGGPMTLPDPLIMTNGLWYNGTPYLGPDAVGRSRGPTPLPPGAASQNPPEESGIAFMWHSHNEREITTNDVFPGGMLMMMLVDPPSFYIDETL